MNGARVSIRPSALGGKGVLLFVALELAFLATNYSNLFFLLLTFSAALGVLGAWWSYRNVRGLSVRGIHVPAAAAGDEREITVQLVASRAMHFDVGVELGVDGSFSEVAHVPAIVEEARLAGTLVPLIRSVQRVPVARLTSRFPFGFFIARVDVPIDCEVVTWPTPADQELRHRRSDADGAGNLMHAGAGSTVSGLRAFQDGDALGDVHWKATARRGTPIVKERERERQASVDVVLDRRCDPDRLEIALSQAAAMVLAARHASPLTIHSQDAAVHVDPERGGASEALRWLAGAQPLPADATAPPARRNAVPLPARGGDTS